MTAFRSLFVTIVATIPVSVACAAEQEVIAPSAYVPLMYHWASNPAVRTELQLSNEQQTQIDALRVEYRAATPKSPKPRKQLTAEERDQFDKEDRTQRATLDPAYLSKLNNVLNEPQQKRLREIYVQSAIWATGLSAASDPPIADSLKLSRDQIVMLRQIQFEWFRSLGAQRQLATKEERDTQYRAELQKRDDAANAVLTPDQRSALTALQGKPFDIAHARSLFPPAPPRE